MADQNVGTFLTNVFAQIPQSFVATTVTISILLEIVIVMVFVDEAWRFINDSSCPEGFDELLCPHRFPCKAGDRISIDTLQVCDGIKNCDDGSDEGSCFETIKSSMFSSDTEMIEKCRTSLYILDYVIAYNCR